METGDQVYNFEDLVEAHFHGMMAKRGFRVVSKQTTLVRYESDRVYVNVYHGRRSYELGIEVDRLDSVRSVEPGFSLGELMDLYAPDKDFRYYVARTPRELHNGVQQLAERVERCADPVLTGDSAVFTRLQQQRERGNREFVLDQEARHVRPRAETAFREKNYEEAANLYESIEEALSPVERKKLEFARKKIAG